MMLDGATKNIELLKGVICVAFSDKGWVIRRIRSPVGSASSDSGDQIAEGSWISPVGQLCFGDSDKKRMSFYTDRLDANVVGGEERCP